MITSLESERPEFACVERQSATALSACITFLGPHLAQWPVLNVDAGELADQRAH